MDNIFEAEEVVDEGNGLITVSDNYTDPDKQGTQVFLAIDNENSIASLAIGYDDVYDLTEWLLTWMENSNDLTQERVAAAEDAI